MVRQRNNMFSAEMRASVVARLEPADRLQREQYAHMAQNTISVVAGCPRRREGLHMGVRRRAFTIAIAGTRQEARADHECHHLARTSPHCDYAACNPIAALCTVLRWRNEKTNKNRLRSRSVGWPNRRIVAQRKSNSKQPIDGARPTVAAQGSFRLCLQPKA